MPDLLTHTLAVYPLTSLSRWKKYSFFLFLGAILPDLGGRIIAVVFADSYWIGWIAAIMHTPLLTLLVCLLIPFFFNEQERKNIFVSLLVGVFSHLFLDSLQKHFQSSYLWFFPFSFKSFEFDFFWPEDVLFVLPFLLTTYLSLFFLTFLRKRRN